MSGSEPRLHHKDRVAVQRLTGDKHIESAKDIDRWQKATGKVISTSSRNYVKPPGPDVSEAEGCKMIDDFREETYGKLPDGETIKELHGDRVLVKVEDEALSTILHIPTTVKGRPKRGKVLMTGPGRVSRDGSCVIPMEVKPGDSVVMLEFSGIDVGNDKRLCEEDEILMVVG